MRLVDEQVIDAGLLPADPAVAGAVEFLAQPLFPHELAGFHLLDHPLALLGVPGPFQPGVVASELGADVPLDLGGGHGDALEDGLGHDHRVPVPGRDPGGERVPAEGLQVVVPCCQHADLGVELEELALELLQHVVGDHDGRLGGQAEAAQLHRAHRHLGGLARPDIVGEQDGRLVDDPRDSGELVRVHPVPEPRRQARQRWPGAVVRAQHQAVEPLVVGADQVRGPFGILPEPFAEPAVQLIGLGPRGDGRGGGLQPLLVLILGGVVTFGAFRADLDRALFQQAGRQGDRVLLLGPPHLGGQHAGLAAGHGPGGAVSLLDLQRRVFQDLPQSLLDEARLDPGRAKPGVDLPRPQVGRERAAQRGDVDLEPRVVPGCLLCVAELGADLAAQVFRRRNQAAGARLVINQLAERGTGFPGGGGAEQPAGVLQPDLPREVHADRDRVGGIGGPLRGLPGGDDPPGEDDGLSGLAGLGIEVLQRVHGCGVRVLAELALRRPVPRQDVIPLLVRLPGALPARPVDRPVCGGVGVITPVQLSAQPGDGRGVVRGGCLGVQQCRDRVPQAEQVAQFPGLGGRARPALPQAVAEHAEAAVVVGPQGPVEPVGLACRDFLGRDRHRAGREPDGELARDAGQVSRGPDGQVMVVVLAAADGEAAQHVLGVVAPVFVDPRGAAVQAGLERASPLRLGTGCSGVGAAQDQQVGDGLGAGRAAVRAAGQPDGRDQAGQPGHLLPGGGVLGVHRVPAGQHREQAARLEERQGLDDEVVVHRMAGGVMPPVMQPRGAERDVADHQVEMAFRQPGVGEGLTPDLRVRVQPGRDRGGDRVQLHPQHLRAARRQPDEVPAAAARFQHLAAVKPQRSDGVPDDLRQRGVGVVRVDRGPPRRRVVRFREQLVQLGAGSGELVPVVVEDLRDRSPP
jgi:hypothetical protein